VFSKAITKQRLDAIAPTLPFTLRTYTPEYCRLFTAHLDDLEDEDGQYEVAPNVRLSRPLNRDEKQFIRNERIICSESFLYAANRYLWVISDLYGKEGSSEREMCFYPTFAQSIYLDLCAEREEAGLHIHMQILKARQLGCSTVSVLIIAWKLAFRDHINALVGSSDPDKTKKMASKMIFAWERMPWWLKPPELITDAKGKLPGVRESGEQMLKIPKQVNFLTLQHGSQFSGIVRGDTVTDFHLSEIPDFIDAEEDIDASLMRAAHPTPYMFGVLESTAKGTEGYWPGLWERSIAGTSKFKPLFFAWFLGKGLYPDPTWLKDRPVPENWKPPQDIANHAKKCENYAASDPTYVKYLGRGWKMPIEQQWYYFNEKRDSQEAAKYSPAAMAKFLEEMPATPQEAFQLSGFGVFSPEQIADIRDRAKDYAHYHCTECMDGPRDGHPYGPAVFGITGPGIVPGDDWYPDPTLIDNDRPAFIVRSRATIDADCRDYTLYPMLPPALDKGLGKLYVWSWYVPAVEHCLGGDCSEGTGKDRTVFSVVRKGVVGMLSAEECCQWAHPNISAMEALPIADCILALYSHIDENESRQCRHNVEMQGGGNGLQHFLHKIFGWGNVHTWEGHMDWMKKHALNNPRMGWVTNTVTRPWLISYLRMTIRTFFLAVNSVWTINELQTLYKPIDSDKIQAEGTAKDDRVFAIGMAFFSLHIWEIEQHMLTGAVLVGPGTKVLNAPPVVLERSGGPNVLPVADDEDDDHAAMERGELLYI
jgi:hypothetical protein